MEDDSKKTLNLLLANGYDITHAVSIKEKILGSYLNNSAVDSFFEFAKEKVNETLGDRCFQYVASRTQLVDELGREQGSVGTEGYRENGCFNCDGHTNRCNRYVTLKMFD